jgi:glutaredoxin-like protein
MSTKTDAPALTVYWRPGCGYCARLRRQLDRAGLSAHWVDIWQDARAAAFVRSVANGNETVPTVVVAGRAMINPRIRAVEAAVKKATPGASPNNEAAPRPAAEAAWQRLRRALFG